MKKLLVLIFVSLLAPAGFAQKWQLEPTHTQVIFSIDHFGISEVSGRFRTFEGTITTTREDFSDAKGEITIDVASVNTESADRDKHLQAEEYFHATKFPKMTYTIESMSKKGNQFEVKGLLTIRGVTKPVILTGQFKGTTKDPWGNTRAGFLRFTTAINRRDFGVSGGGILIGNEVRINISAELVQVK
jgi:polyisoprenoid-binding protein YceI